MVTSPIQRSTRSGTFGESVQEIRAGVSHIVLMPQYRRPLPLRIVENFKDIVSDAPDQGLGRNLWTQRVFRHCDDGEVRSLDQLSRSDPPMLLRLLTSGLCLLSHRWIKPALEWAMPQTKELSPSNCPGSGSRCVSRRIFGSTPLFCVTAALEK